MKIKTLRKIDTKEFVHLMQACKSTGDYIAHCEYDVFTGELPMVLNPEVTRDKVIEHYHGVDFSDIELIEFDFVISGDIGADIRNKLSPIKNLITLLANDVDVNSKFVQNEIKQSKISVDYLANLL